MSPPPAGRVPTAPRKRSPRYAVDKGRDAEREIASLLRDLTGWPVERRLQEGRRVDSGDLTGLPECCCQVKARSDVVRSIREALDELPAQHAAAGCQFAVAFVKRPRQRWVAVMTPEMFAALLREATA